MTGFDLTPVVDVRAARRDRGGNPGQSTFLNPSSFSLRSFGANSKRRTSDRSAARRKIGPRKIHDRDTDSRNLICILQ